MAGMTPGPSSQGWCQFMSLVQLNFYSAPVALKMALVWMTNYAFTLGFGPLLNLRQHFCFAAMQI